MAPLALTRAIVTVLGAAVLFTTPLDAQQKPHGAAGGGRPPEGAAHQHGGRADAEACEREFAQVIADGRGFGMAFAADRNGYPGPLHVLELAPRLRLTPEQETKVRGLRDAMFAESRPKGAGLIDAERRLTGLFASGTADDAAVRAAVTEVERLRAELRALHLTTHLRTRDLLTAEQRRVYHAERWGGR